MACEKMSRAFQYSNITANNAWDVDNMGSPFQFSVYEHAKVLNCIHLFDSSTLQLNANIYCGSRVAI